MDSVLAIMSSDSALPSPNPSSISLISASVSSVKKRTLLTDEEKDLYEAILRAKLTVAAQHQRNFSGFNENVL